MPKLVSRGLKSAEPSEAEVFIEVFRSKRTGRRRRNEPAAGEEPPI